MDLLREYVRMCAEVRLCRNCPLCGIGKVMDCHLKVKTNYDKAVEAITKWAKEHPQKTYAQDFLEKFPNATRSDDVPALCWCHVYPGNKDGRCLHLKKTCRECWNQPMED